MPNQLRKEEKFAIEALAKHFGTDWHPGEDPPDAYLSSNGREIAVEISTLFQRVTNERGEDISREKDDKEGLRLISNLQAKIKDSISGNRFLSIAIHSPVYRFSKFEKYLEEKIREIVRNEIEVECNVELFGNRADLHYGMSDELYGRNVFGVVLHRNPNRNIALNALHSLEERIVAKTEKCKAVDRPIWLLLLNEYWLAEPETYRYTMGQLDIAHPFEKIFLVTNAGTVTLLN